MDGKFYDIPDDQAAQFEVPRDKVKELLEKSGVPAPQGGPGPSQAPGPMSQQGPQQGPPQGAGAPPPAVLVQIYGAQPTPSYGPPPAQQQQPQGEPAQGGDGDVNPYWWWRNITFYRPWGNYWPNWGNY
jgi:hypothetical protein